MKLTWKAGAWFGSQLGITCWIAVAGLLSLGRDARTGLALLGLFAANNLVGWQLWRQRARRSCYPATQLLLGLGGLSGLLAVYALDRAGLWDAIQVGARVPAGVACALLAAVVLGLMLTFHVRFGAER